MDFTRTSLILDSGKSEIHFAYINYYKSKTQIVDTDKADPKTTTQRISNIIHCYNNIKMKSMSKYR